MSDIVTARRTPPAPKPPSRHLSMAQRAGLGALLLALVVLVMEAAGYPVSPTAAEVVIAVVYVLGGSAGATASVSAGRDVASAWTRPPTPAPRAPTRYDERQTGPIDERP